MAKLKVYGWRDFREDTGQQCRRIMAAHSRAEVERKLGKRISPNSDCFSETGNKEEIEIAMSNAGEIFQTESIHERLYARRQTMTAPKPTLPSAKPEVGTAKIWVKERMGESGFDVGRAVQDLICSNCYGAESKLVLLLESYARFYAKSIAAKAAEKAAEEIDDTFDAIERGASIPFGVEEVAAIIQKCFDTEIEREQ